MTAGPAARSLSRAEALAAVLPPLLVAAERVAATISQGVHGRRRVGAGETFWQFRAYQPGDSTQRIDWRQSARTERVYIRENEWEAAQSVWLWCDRSESMRWRGGRDRPTKLERAELLTLALASLLTRGGERATLLGSGVPPSSGRATLRRLAAALQQRGLALSLPPAEPLPRDGRLVMLGDFLAPVDGLRQSIAGFARRGVRGHLLQVFDPAEATLPFSGRVLFEGAESEGRVLFGRTETIRDDYRAAFTRHQAAVRDAALQAGWTVQAHATDHPPQTALLTLYLALAGQGRR